MMSLASMGDADGPGTSAAHAVGVMKSLHGGHMGGRSIGSKKKIRHHVNPLKDIHMAKIDLPERWPEKYFADPEKPLHVDIGCARGLFCLDLASTRHEVNVLGLEIRAALAEAATEDVKRIGLPNAAFLACNANSNLEHILSLATPCTALRSVSIQFPGACLEPCSEHGGAALPSLYMWW